MSSIRKPVLATGIAATLAAMPPASAVELNARGTGQVLIYPYYTVNDGNAMMAR